MTDFLPSHEAALNSYRSYISPAGSEARWRLMEDAQDGIPAGQIDLPLAYTPCLHFAELGEKEDYSGTPEVCAHIYRSVPLCCLTSLWVGYSSIK